MIGDASGGSIQWRPERPPATHRFRFGEIEKAFLMMKTKEGGIIKPLITFN